MTHEGAPAARLTPLEELRRTTKAALLWEDSFYENGIALADRVRDLVPKCPAGEVGRMAVTARTEGRLRHMPLLLMRELVRHPDKPAVAADLAEVIRRPDELAEFLAIYWREGKCPLSN